MAKPKPIPPNIAKAKLSKKTTSFPPTYWIVITNLQPGWTWIVVPASGNLWLYYEWGSAPAAQIYVWHQGGTTTPVNPGENNIQVGSQDMIMYQLTNPGSDSIKLGYQLT
ncbi:MAG: hypothetical protein QOH01_1810 [Verrucomicrobiota bacterium]|jgi:hypothetical protein